MPPELSSGRTIAEFADVSACAETILLKRKWAAGLGRNAETALQQTECRQPQDNRRCLSGAHIIGICQRIEVGASFGPIEKGLIRKAARADDVLAAFLQWISLCVLRRLAKGWRDERKLLTRVRSWCDHVPCGLAQYVLFCAFANLIVNGEAGRIFADMMIEERHTPLDRMCHLHAIAQHGQNVIDRSEEHTSELQSPCNLVCRLLLEKK